MVFLKLKRLRREDMPTEIFLCMQYQFPANDGADVERESRVCISQDVLTIRNQRNGDLMIIIWPMCKNAPQSSILRDEGDE